MTSWKKSPAAVLITLIVLHVMAQIDRNMLLGFSPQITKDLMLTNGQYGFLVGAVWVLSFGVMAVFLGSLADRFSLEAPLLMQGAFALLAGVVAFALVETNPRVLARRAEGLPA